MDTVDKEMSAIKPAPTPTFNAVQAAMNVTNQLEPVSEKQRHTINAALLGTCIVFSATLTGVSHLDTSLTVAMYLFAVAIPCLGLEFLALLFRPKADADETAQSVMDVFAAVMAGIGALLGFLATAGGIAAVFIHSVGVGPVIIAFGTVLVMLVVFWTAGVISLVRKAQQAAKSRPTHEEAVS